MRIRLLAVGRRMPKWVTTAYEDYARRLPRECRLELVEIAPGRRAGGDVARAIAEEDSACARPSAPTPRSSRSRSTAGPGRPKGSPTTCAPGWPTGAIARS